MSDPQSVRVDEDGNLHLPARIIPVPASLSAAARSFLASAGAPGERPPYPAPGDVAAWRKHVDAFNEEMDRAATALLEASPARVETTSIAGVTVHVAIADGMPDDNRDYAHIAIHGGGMVYGAGQFAKSTGVQAALQTPCPAYSVDFRNPPEHPYPAALDDCVAVYRELLASRGPEKIVISGGSGGGNLAAAAILKARDLGLPLPAAVALHTPEVDLTEAGDTFQTNRGIDVVLRGGLPQLIDLYANGADLTHPYLSPLFGDFEKGYPPTCITTGTRDVFLSNSVRMHRALLRAGVEAELHVWEAMPHGFLGGASPEDAELHAQTGAFLRRHLGLG